MWMKEPEWEAMHQPRKEQWNKFNRQIYWAGKQLNRPFPFLIMLTFYGLHHQDTFHYKSLKCGPQLSSWPCIINRSPLLTLSHCQVHKRKQALSYLKDIYLEANPQIYHCVLVSDEIVELIVEISTDAHICVHPMQLAGKLITTGLLENKLQSM